jgi:hypothetical protein
MLLMTIQFDFVRLISSHAKRTPSAHNRTRLQVIFSSAAANGENPKLGDYFLSGLAVEPVEAAI